MTTVKSCIPTNYMMTLTQNLLVAFNVLFSKSLNALWIVVQNHARPPGNGFQNFNPTGGISGPIKLSTGQGIYRSACVTRR